MTDGYDPKSTMGRRHFMGYKAGSGSAPPPLHVVSCHPEANHYPMPRPMGGSGAVPGPALIIGGTGMPCLGIDPTDPGTWAGRGYRQSTGMIGRFNLETDWGEIGGQGVRTS